MDINLNDLVGPLMALGLIALGVVILAGEYCWNQRQTAKAELEQPKP